MFPCKCFKRQRGGCKRAARSELAASRRLLPNRTRCTDVRERYCHSASQSWPSRDSRTGAELSQFPLFGLSLCVMWSFLRSGKIKTKKSSFTKTDQTGFQSQVAEPHERKTVTCESVEPRCWKAGATGGDAVNVVFVLVHVTGHLPPGPVPQPALTMLMLSSY